MLADAGASRPLGLISGTLFSGVSDTHFALLNDEGDTALEVDENGAVSGEKAFTVWLQQYWFDNGGSWSIPVRRGGYQDAETGLVYAGDSSYYLPGRGGFLTPTAPGFLDGNPYGYQPISDDGDWALPDDPTGRQFYYDGFRHTVHQGAGMAEKALVIAPRFNPICQALEARYGEDAAGHRVSKLERFPDVPCLASGGSADLLRAGVETEKVGRGLLEAGAATRCVACLHRRGAPTMGPRSVVDVTAYSADGSIVLHQIYTTEAWYEDLHAVVDSPAERVRLGVAGMEGKKYDGARHLEVSWRLAYDNAGELTKEWVQHSDGTESHARFDPCGGPDAR